MKRFAYAAVVAAMLGLGAFTIADAHDAGQEARRRGPGGAGPFARLADLTDAQREQIRSLVEQERQSRDGAPAHADLRRQLHVELLADAPDEQKIATLQQQIAEAAAAAVAREVALQRQIAQVLTAEQRAQVRERLAQAPERGPRGGVERRGPGRF